MGKYFKYAIGEILLVVIGILIALQINNWNNQQQDRKREAQLLQNLKEEFQQNLDELKRDHAINVSCLQACKTLLNFPKDSTPNPNYIDSLMGKVYNFATFDARLGVINDVTSSGKLELLQDNNLKFKLIQWTAELDDYEEDVVIRREYWINNLSPLVNSYLPIRNTDFTQDRPDYKRDDVVNKISAPEQNYYDFMNNLKVDGSLFEYYINQSFVTTNEESIKEYLEDILHLLNQNINEN
ncbi:DUF6090 family protein [Winogradskyella sp. A3E31]|uniref:DUF6090 family protein n=1 Tax=Winogradskyella sp. A3E31 TaxID=3349637 RepID=UPI00398B3DB0